MPGAISLAAHVVGPYIRIVCETPYNEYLISSSLGCGFPAAPRFTYLPSRRRGRHRQYGRCVFQLLSSARGDREFAASSPWCSLSAAGLPLSPVTSAARYLGESIDRRSMAASDRVNASFLKVGGAKWVAVGLDESEAPDCRADSEKCRQVRMVALRNGEYSWITIYTPRRDMSNSEPKNMCEINSLVTLTSVRRLRSIVAKLRHSHACGRGAGLLSWARPAELSACIAGALTAS